MDHFKPGRTIFEAGLILVVGISLAAWGYRILRDPTRLKKGSLIYRWLHTSTWRWGREESPGPTPELSHRQIRFWAAMALLAGVITALAGIAGLLEMILFSS
jgi:hypothetical protein